MSQKTDWVIQLYVWHCKLESSTLKEKSHFKYLYCPSLIGQYFCQLCCLSWSSRIENIANRVYGFTTLLANEISRKHQLVNNKWFDTLTVKLNGVSSDEILAKALNEYDINMFRVDESTVSLQLDETVQKQDLINLVNVFTGQENYSPDELPAIPQELLRSDEILTNEVLMPIIQKQQC